MHSGRHGLRFESTCVHWPDCPRRSLVQAPEITSSPGIHKRVVFFTIVTLPTTRVSQGDDSAEREEPIGGKSLHESGGGAFNHSLREPFSHLGVWPYHGHVTESD